MKIRSLIQNGNRLEVAEVEIEFIPGVPQIHFLGLPDRIIKESFYRIKSSIKNSGYKFPGSSQIIVNIKPNHLRKSSRGVELAVALGLLMNSGQLPEDAIPADWVVYGELGLDGSVYEPTDLQQSLFYLSDFSVLSGKGKADCYQLESLRGMEITKSKAVRHLKRPQAGLQKLFTEEEAEFLFLAATSGLHALLAGDSGAGKSTLAHSLSAFLAEPDPKEHVRLEDGWRPVVSPHQSITPGAFLGGGGSLYEGEIERAQGGVLLLDELLEFDPEILEALRGPMTGEKLRISRGSQYREINCDFQVVATTNLCQCGKWTPIHNEVNCGYTRARCGRILERFSGPILDRFGLLIFSAYKGKRVVKGADILERVKRCRELPEIPEEKEYPLLFDGYYSRLSTRRKNYLFKIAVLYARDRVAQGSCSGKGPQVCLDDLSRAERWVIRPFEQLQKGMS